MGKPIGDDERQAIADDLTSGATIHATAKKHRRAKGTVAKIAKEQGVRAPESARSRVAHARETRMAVSAERRAELAVEAAEKMAEAMSRLGEPSHVVMLLPGGKHGPPETTVVEVPAGARDWRDQAGAVRSLQQTMLDLVKYDERGDDDGADVDRWLEHITGGEL